MCKITRRIATLDSQIMHCKGMIDYTENEADIPHRKRRSRLAWYWRRRWNKLLMQRAQLAARIGRRPTLAEEQPAPLSLDLTLCDDAKALSRSEGTRTRAHGPAPVPGMPEA